MFLTFDGQPTLDFDLGFLADLLALLDSHLTTLRTAALNNPDADGQGIFHSQDYIVGIGFVACQGYIAATYSQLSLNKGRALALGPSAAMPLLKL